VVRAMSDDRLVRFLLRSSPTRATGKVERLAWLLALFNICQGSLRHLPRSHAAQSRLPAPEHGEVENVTTRVRPSIIIAALVAIPALFWVFDVQRASAFRVACSAVTPGAGRQDVVRALERAGGRASRVSEREEIWVQEAAIFERRGICTVRFDASKRATSTRYERDKRLGSRY